MIQNKEGEQRPAAIDGKRPEADDWKSALKAPEKDTRYKTTV